MHVCKISSITKRKSFESNKENIEVSIHKMLVCGIPKEQNLNLLDIQTPTMQDSRLKGRAPRAHVNCWEDHLFYGHQRSKIVLYYQPSKPNTYPPIVVVHKFFG